MDKFEDIELSDGSVIKCRVLTSNEYSSLKESKGNIFIPKYQKTHGVDAYRLKNGNIMSHENDEYTLFFNEEDFKRVYDDLSNWNHGVEILFNKNPYGDKFPHSTQLLIKTLADSLDVKVESNCCDKLFLKEIDYKMNKLTNPSRLKKKYFLNLIALLGESLIKQYNLKWSMVLASDGYTWYPNLAVKNQVIEFVPDFYENVFINESSTPLEYSFFNIAIINNIK